MTTNTTKQDEAAMTLTDEQILDAIKSVCDIANPRFPEAFLQYREESLVLGRAVERAVLSASKPAAPDIEAAMRAALGDKYCAPTQKPRYDWLSPTSADYADLVAAGEIDHAPAAQAQPAVVLDDERAAFEAWAKQEGLEESLALMIARRAWLARAASPRSKGEKS